MGEQRERKLERALEDAEHELTTLDNITATDVPKNIADVLEAGDRERVARCDVGNRHRPRCLGGYGTRWRKGGTSTRGVRPNTIY
jgi:hypothetical protein